MKLCGSVPCSQDPATDASLTPCVIFRNKLDFYSEKLLAFHPCPKLEEHPSSSLRYRLLKLFVVKLRICRPLLPSAT